MKASINWIKDYIKISEPVNNIAHRLTMSGLEVKKITQTAGGDDSVFEVEITSNRPDWLSHLGIARELGAIYGNSVTYPSEATSEKRGKTDKVGVCINDESLCPFYTAVLLENVENDESPQFIKERLAALGVRSINLPVDLTNFVLSEYGQPLHVFDFDRIGNNIIIRRAQKGEKIAAINEKEYALDTEDLVICDEKGPIALAGVMGGVQSEVSSQTRNILLESAFFDPITVRRSSRRHQLVSESSYRFERKVDPQGVVKASDRFIHLMTQYSKVKKISLIIRAGKPPVQTKSISLSYDYVDNILGLKIPHKSVNAILEDLGLTLKEKHKNEMSVIIPSFRSDLERPIDLVEEIARIYGYDKVPETYPQVSISKKAVDINFKLDCAIRRSAVSLGMNEVITYSLVNPQIYELFYADILSKAISIVNPSNKELTLMRPSLINGMLDVIRTNINNGNKDIKAFEIGRIYLKKKGGDLPDERKILSFGMTGCAYNNWLDHAREINYFDLKGVIEGVLNSLNVVNISYAPLDRTDVVQGVNLLIDKAPIAYFGKVNKNILTYYDIQQDVFYGEITLGELTKKVVWEKKFIEFSKFPSSHRDLSIVVNESVKVADIICAIKSSGADIIKNLVLFDQYKGKQIQQGTKSLTFSIEYQADDRTLSNDEVESLHLRIVDVLAQKYKAQLRS